MPPSAKRRKTTERAEEVIFDPEARQDYLTGFHKRKQQRIKHAKDQAEKMERELRIESRKKMREQRKQDLESHVQAVQEMMEKTQPLDVTASDEDGESDAEKAGKDLESKVDGVSEGREDEYIDEEKFTTVIVEPMNMSGNGQDEDDSEAEEGMADGHDKAMVPKTPKGTATTKRVWTKEKPATSKPKVKKKKFRYETKHERKAARSKLAEKNSAAAKARRDAE